MIPFPIISNTDILPPLPEIKKLATADGNTTDNSIALLYDNGELYMMGTNRTGSLGTGDNLAVLTWRLVLTDVRDVYVGRQVTLCLMNDGTFKYSGSPNSMFNGVNIGSTLVWISAESYLSWIDKSRFKEYILSGGITNFGFALYTDGTLYGTGQNSNLAIGVPGSGLTPPTIVGTSVKKVQSSNSSTWYLSTDNRVYRCGKNTNGCILGANTAYQLDVFTEYDMGTKVVVDVAVSQNSVRFVMQDGSAYVCGDNQGIGIYGNGSTSSTLALVQSTSLTAHGISSISPGYDKNILICTDGLYACGFQQRNGELGIGKSTNGASVNFVKCSGTVSGQVISDIKFLCSRPYSTYYVYNSDVYCTGFSADILKAQSISSFERMSTPKRPI